MKRRRSQFFRTTLARIVTSLSLISAAGTGAAYDDATGEECTFRGEIVHADSYEDIIIVRNGPARNDDHIGPHSPLFQGDVIVVKGSQTVFIRSQANGDPRAITANDGRVTIGAEGCDVDSGFGSLLESLWRALRRVWAGPVLDEPEATYPRNAAVEELQLNLPFAGPQFLTASQSDFVLNWAGPEASVELISSMGMVLFKGTDSNGITIVSGAYEQPLEIGDTLTLTLRSETDTFETTIEVLPDSELPVPGGVETLDGASPTELAIYAMWLASKGPEQWRLEGLTRLTTASEYDYMAWKLRRSLMAELGGNE